MTDLVRVGAQEEDELVHQATRALCSVLVLPAGRMQLLALDEEGMRAGVPSRLETLLALCSHPLPAIGDAAMRSVVHSCVHPCSAAAHFLSLDRGVSRLCSMLSASHSSKRRKATVTGLSHLAFAAKTAAAPNAAAGPASPAASADNACEIDLEKLIPCIAPLVELLGACDCAQTRAQAAVVLGHLGECRASDAAGETAELAFHTIHAGALPILKELSESDDPQLRAACGGALESICACLTPQSRRVFVPKIESLPRQRPRRRSRLGVDAPSVLLPRTAEARAALANSTVAMSRHAVANSATPADVPLTRPDVLACGEDRCCEMHARLLVSA